MGEGNQVSKPLSIIGRAAYITLPALEISQIACKIDTGAYTSSLHSHKPRVVEKNGQKVLQFEIPGELCGDGKTRTFETSDYKRKLIRSSTGHEQERFVIKTIVVLKGRRFKAEFSLSNRNKMRYPILIGRKLLRRRFLVDVTQKFI